MLGAFFAPFIFDLTARAQTLAGEEFQVNSYTAGYQFLPSIASDSAGNFVIAWNSLGGQDGDGPGVFARRFDGSGSPIGSEFQVNTNTVLDQDTVAVSGAPSGDFVAVWASYPQDGSGWGIFGQRYASDGGATGSEFQINGDTNDFQQQPDVAVDGTGNFVVAWRSPDGDGQGVFARRFANDGTAFGGDFQVNTDTAGYQGFPTIGADTAGNFTIVWVSAGVGGDAIVARRYANTGAPLGTEFVVNTHTEGYQFLSTMAVKSDGGFVVTWTSYGPSDGSGAGTFAQRFDSAGDRQGEEFLVNSYTIGVQGGGGIAAGPDGGFTVVWSSYGQDGSGYGLFGQRFDSAGTRDGSEFQVNTYTGQTQSGVSSGVAVDGAGQLIVTWASDGQDGSLLGVFAQRFAAPTIPASPTPSETPTPATTDTPTETPTEAPSPLCGAAPRGGCRTPVKSRLTIKDRPSDDHDVVVFTASHGAATTLADLGDPASETSYAVCVYEGGVLLFQLRVPAAGSCAGADCWRPLGAAEAPRGYQYRDEERTPDGVRKLLIEAGAEGHGRIVLKAQGDNVPDAERLSLSAPIVVEIINDANGVCWGDAYDSGGMTENGGGVIKAHALNR